MSFVVVAHVQRSHSQPGELPARQPLPSTATKPSSRGGVYALQASLLRRLLLLHRPDALIYDVVTAIQGRQMTVHLAQLIGARPVVNLVPQLRQLIGYVRHLQFNDTNIMGCDSISGQVSGYPQYKACYHSYCRNELQQQAEYFIPPKLFNCVHYYAPLIMRGAVNSMSIVVRH